MASCVSFLPISGTVPISFPVEGSWKRQEITIRRASGQTCDRDGLPIECIFPLPVDEGFRLKQPFILQPELQREHGEQGEQHTMHG